MLLEYDMRYYIYIYLNKTKPGIFSYETTNYGILKFEYEPVYVGKGAGNRAELHLSQSHNIRLDEIIKNNKYIFYKIDEGLPSHIAYQLETELIYRIGRIDLETGPLVNECAGVHLVEAEPKDNISPYNLEFNKFLLILQALNNNKTQKAAAKTLNVSERTIYRYIHDYKLKKIDNEWNQVV